MNDRKTALESVIRHRLGALTEQQLEVVDRETTRMVIEVVEGEDCGVHSENWKQNVQI